MVTPCAGELRAEKRPLGPCTLFSVQVHPHPLCTRLYLLTPFKFLLRCEFPWVG